MRKNKQFLSDLCFEVAKTKKKTTEIKNSVKKLYNWLERTEVVVESDNASRQIGKGKGKYVCFNYNEQIYDDNKKKEQLEKTLIKELVKFYKSETKKLNSVLVFGLGNEKFVADSLGKKVVDKTLVTNDVLDKIDTELASVCALSVGVLGTTGFESAKLLKSLCNIKNFDLVIVVDSLVANNYKRLGVSVQISNASIVPGGGLMNKRQEISKEYLGVPVLVLGVPLVVYATSLCDANEVNNAKNKKGISNLVVTPKNIDYIVKSVSTLLANAINFSVQNDKPKEYIKSLL